MLAILAQLDGNDKVLIGVVVTAIVAPNIASWRDGRVARKQLTPNGGTSLLDKVTRIEDRQKRVEVKIDTVQEVVDLHTAELANIKNKVRMRPAPKRRDITQEMPVTKPKAGTARR